MKKKKNIIKNILLILLGIGCVGAVISIVDNNNDSIINPSNSESSEYISNNTSNKEVSSEESSEETNNNDYEFISPYGLNSWQLNENESVTGTCEGGTTWLTTSALKTNTDNVKNFYMESTIQVNKLATGYNTYTATDINQYKVGLCPYYLDINNYTFVWLGRWADGSLAQCIVTSRINGVLLTGAEFITTNWLSYDITSKVTMGVEINEDDLQVYLTDLTEETNIKEKYEFTLDGLSDRTINNSKYGFNIFNVSATFSSILFDK